MIVMFLLQGLPLLYCFIFHMKIYVPYCQPFFMKPTLLLGCTLLAGTALHAQFQFLPYAGFEQSRTTLNTNILSAQDINGFLKAGLRTGYQLKGGHSPFVNFTTNPGPVSFAFDNTGSLLNQYRTTNLQLRFEAGYQYSSKPIQLGKSRSPQRSVSQLAVPTTTQKKSCGSSMYRSSCGSKQKQAPQAPANNNLNMRLQPSLALAYIPSSTQLVTQKGTGFDYTPAWRTTVVPAMSFEFAKGAQRLFSLGVFYTAPLGQKEQNVTTSVESETITTTLRPQLATWGVTLGVPFSFAKAKTMMKSPTAPRVHQTSEKNGCTKTYYRRYMQIQ